MTVLYRTLAAVRRGLELFSFQAARLTGWLVVAMAATMMGALVLQIVFRYGVGQALVWSEELALFLFTWIVLLTGSLGVREDFHVRLTLVSAALPAGLQRWLSRALTLVIVGFGAALAFSGHRYLDATLGQVSAAVRYPIEALHAAAPVCGWLIVLHGLARLARGPVEPAP
jgi:TRAP-type C4-dicarboxylate transport system permease small subunit